MTTTSRVGSIAFKVARAGRLSAIARDTAGTSAIEFAFIAPLLMLLALGTVQFGLTLNNYIRLTEAVRTGARQLAVSRGGGHALYRYGQPDLPVGPKPRSHQPDDRAVGQRRFVYDRHDLLRRIGQRPGAAGERRCDLSLRPVGHGARFLPGCTLSSQTTERVE